MIKSYKKSEYKANNSLINSISSLNNSNTNISNFESCLTKKRNAKDLSRLEIQMAALLKLASQEKQKEKQNEELEEEWREAIRRFEVIFFFIFLIAFFLLPWILFGGFFFRDISKSKFQSCACMA